MSHQSSSFREGHDQGIKMIAVRLMTWKGVMVELEMEGSDTIGLIKKTMNEVDGTPEDRQIVLLEGAELEDERTLEHYNIGDGCKLDQRFRRYVLPLLE